MWYYKFEHDGHIIEFKNNSWDGIEHIIVDDVPMSSKFSIMGTTHEFILDGSNYVIILKVTDLSMTSISLSCYVNRQPIIERAELKANFYSGSSLSYDLGGHRWKGKKYMQLWDIDDAILEFKQAIDSNPKDYESMFYLACCYSINEDIVEGIKFAKASLKKGVKMQQKILTDDRLAYLRMQPEFDIILESFNK